MREVPTVPSYLRDPSAAVCWNCDRDCEGLIAVTLQAPSGSRSTIRLCDRCYDAVYVPLVARTEAIGAATGQGGSTLTLREARSGPA